MVNRHTTEVEGNETKNMAHRALHNLQLTHSQTRNKQTSPPHEWFLHSIPLSPQRLPHYGVTVRPIPPQIFFLDPLRDLISTSLLWPRKLNLT